MQKAEPASEKDCALQQNVAECAPMIEQICTTLMALFDRLAIPDRARPVIRMADAELRLQRDPASGSDSLVGVWSAGKGSRLGNFIIHADQSFFAEYDVLCAHPTLPGKYIESLTAWGRGSLIKSEAELLDLPPG
jgi:hypothetical protein